MKPVEFDSLIIVPICGWPRLSACLTGLGFSIEMILSSLELTRCRSQTPSSLRQHGAYRFSCISFFALRAKKEIQKDEKYRCERSHLDYHVSPVKLRKRSFTFSILNSPGG